MKDAVTKQTQSVESEAKVKSIPAPGLIYRVAYERARERRMTWPLVVVESHY